MIVAPPTRTRVAVFVVLAVVLASCGAGSGRSTPTIKRSADALDGIVAAARSEGELSLSWTAGYLDAPKELSGYIEGFNKLYGLNLEIRFVPAGRLGDAAVRLAQDVQAGRTPFTDVFLGTEAETSALAKAAALAPEMWSSWAPNIKNLKLVAPGGVAVEVQSRLPGITYSSQRLVGSEVPRSLSDLLRPRYKGRIATTPDASTFDRLASPEVWGMDKAVDYARKLGPQLSGVMECGDEGRVVSGEFDVFVYDCGSARVAQLKADGALIGWSVPADAGFLRYLYMGVPKGAAHPNAARLWINFILGREAQDLMYQYEYADNYLLTGSRSFAEIDRATKAGARFYELTVEQIQSDEARGFRSASTQVQTVLLKDSAPPRR